MLWWLAHNTVTASVLALAVLLVCRFWSFRPSIRHALWLVVLLKLIAPPFVAWPWNPLEAMGLIKPEAQAGALELSQIWVVNLVNVDISDRALATYQLAAPHVLSDDEASSRSDPASESSQSLGYWQPIILSLWALGASCMFAVQLIRASRFRRLMRGWRPAPRRLRRQVDRLAKQMNLSRPRLLLLPGLHSPFIWSLLRPWLLWPGALDEHLSPESHKAVIVHELAHLRRCDHWVGWLQLAGECIFWWNPLFWFVRRQIRFHAELSCDAWVMRLLPEARRAYAEALIEVTALISRAPAPVPALGMSSAARQDFERRLTMIMSEKIPDKAPLVGLAAIGLLALAVLPAFSQDAKAPADPTKAEIVFSTDDLAKGSSEAKIDALIGELDSLISTINAAHDDNTPAKKTEAVLELKSADELKLVEAIELAYSEALLLKEGDDNQSEKSREEKIKQIEKNLQELLKEVQSLKSGTGAKGPYKIEYAPKIVTGSKQPMPKGAIAVPGKHGQEVKIIQGKPGQSGDVIYELVTPQQHLILGDGKGPGAAKEVEGKKTITVTVDPKTGETRRNVTVFAKPQEGQAKTIIGHIAEGTKDGHAGHLMLDVTKSKDGQSLIINGKAVPLPKDGESKTITIEATPGAEKGKPIILHLQGANDGQPIKIDGKVIVVPHKGDGRTFHFESGEKVEPKIFKFIETEKKQGAEKGEHPQHLKQIIVNESGDGRLFFKHPAEGSGKIELKGEIIELKEGKQSIRIDAGDLKLQPKVTTGFKVESKTPATATHVAPVYKVQPSTATWKIEADKDEKGGVRLWTVDADKPATKDGQGKTWTYVESGSKSPAKTKATYKLPKGKAAAVAAFLKENVKSAGLETKVDGDSLIVTASPEAHKAISSLISLMQGKAATGSGNKTNETKLEFKFVPDGKNNSFNGIQNFQEFKAVTPQTWAGATKWAVEQPLFSNFGTNDKTWFSSQPAAFGTFFAPAKVESKTGASKEKNKENDN